MHAKPVACFVLAPLPQHTHTCLAAILCAHRPPSPQAGLVALHNPPPASSSSREDPLHHPDFRALAANLPYAKHVHSKLICAVTRQIMTDANPPLVLPNGYVYSQAGVDALAARNGGRIVCPRTGAEFGYEEARRAYIV